ncbi:hypothetical protein [Solihabitans fulvus]|uniref:hypothetical protein n=1 Tax=Solihabitans fulvus TaxID=1892852 RepID=UPI001CB76550|nr:hypothetical protein [Solihabitans fulvus]
MTQINDPPPAAPPGKLAEVATTFVGWLKWGLLITAVVALVVGGIMMITGRRNRNQMAVEGAMSLPWVVGGIGMGLGAVSIVLFVSGSS